MGTRGAFGFRIEGQDKVSYNHSDSYPSGLGAALLQELRALSAESLKEIAQSIELVRETDVPTQAQQAHCAPWSNFSVGTRSADSWYCLLREAQGTLQPYREGLTLMLDQQTFLKDSLFCEWAYIADIDTDMLEVYRGFQQTLGDGRYNQEYPGGKPEGSVFRGYTGVALFCEIPLAAVRTLAATQINALCALLSAEKTTAEVAEWLSTASEEAPLGGSGTPDTEPSEGFDIVRTSDEAFDVYCKGQYLANFNHDDHGWGGMADAEKLIEKIAAVIGIPVIQRDED